MIGKKKRIQKENDLLARVYDLILNKETLDDERSKLIEFKNEIENGKDFEKQVMKLSRDLRLLALSKAKDKKNLSLEVGKLYMDISSTGFLKEELGRGIVSLSGVIGNS